MRLTKGFTLIEMAIVLAIVGLIGVLTLPPIIDVIKHSKIEATRKQLRSLRSDVLGYALTMADNALPNSTEYMGYPEDAWGSEIRYRAASALTGSIDICELSTPPSNLLRIESDDEGLLTEQGAFFLGSPGANYTPEWTNASDTITLNQSSDDITQFITYNFLYKKICQNTAKPEPEPDPGPAPSPGDIGSFELASDNDWYQGQGVANNIVKDNYDEGKSIKVDRSSKSGKEGTDVPNAGKTIMRADAIAFETEVEPTLVLNKNTELIIEVKESVIFTGEIDFNNSGIIRIRSFADYPIDVYIIETIYSDLYITPDENFTVGTWSQETGDTYKKLTVNGAITIEDS